MNRRDARQLAADRLLDAEALLNASRWAGAYHLTGYALECGLKACILARVERTGEIFIDKQFSAKCFNHDQKNLVELAGLTSELGIERGINPAFDAYWKQAVEWKTESRYKQQTEVQARELFEAMSDVSNGVLRWIRLYW